MENRDKMINFPSSSQQLSNLRETISQDGDLRGVILNMLLISIPF